MTALMAAAPIFQTMEHYRMSGQLLVRFDKGEVVEIKPKAVNLPLAEKKEQ